MAAILARASHAGDGAPAYETIMIVHEKIIEALRKIPMRELLKRFDEDKVYLVNSFEAGSVGLFEVESLGYRATVGNFDHYCRKMSRTEFIIFITSLIV